MRNLFESCQDDDTSQTFFPEALQIRDVLFFSAFNLFFSSRADVSAFFSASCIPGAGAMAPPLCALCQGQKSYIRRRNYHCETSHSEPFYNSHGALRSASPLRTNTFWDQDLKQFKHEWISLITSVAL